MLNSTDNMKMMVIGQIDGVPALPHENTGLRILENHFHVLTLSGVAWNR